MPTLTIERTWDGLPVGFDEAVTLTVEVQGHGLLLGIDAPFHDDPPPPGPPGPTWALWEHEVVEVFVLGAAERYTELELGPWGHHLVLRLEGRRNIVEKLLPIDLEVERKKGRWRGSLVVPAALIPTGPLRFNATAVHGAPGRRRHLAWMPMPGECPDFHCLECFAPLPEPG